VDATEQIDELKEMILDFCSFKNFLGFQPESPKLDALKESLHDDKKEYSDLVFVDNTEDILREAVSMLKKCTEDSTKIVFALAEEIQSDTSDNLIYKLQLLKVILCTTKLSPGTEDTELKERKDLLERLDKSINECLKASQILPLLNPEDSSAVQLKCVEVLGLLMILDVEKFDRYIDVFIKSIENERAEPHKSRSVGVMLKTIFDALRVNSYMKLERLPHMPED